MNIIINCIDEIDNLLQVLVIRLMLLLCYIVKQAKVDQELYVVHI